MDNSRSMFVAIIAPKINHVILSVLVMEISYNIRFLAYTLYEG